MIKKKKIKIETGEKEIQKREEKRIETREGTD